MTASSVRYTVGQICLASILSPILLYCWNEDKIDDRDSDIGDDDLSILERNAASPWRSSAKQNTALLPWIHESPCPRFEHRSSYNDSQNSCTSRYRSIFWLCREIRPGNRSKNALFGSRRWFRVATDRKAPIHFLTKFCDRFSCNGNLVLRFHWSASLVSRNNWSDRTTESESGEREREREREREGGGWCHLNMTLFWCEVQKRPC